MATKNRLLMKSAAVSTDDLDDDLPKEPYEPRTAPGQLMGLQAKVLALEEELRKTRGTAGAVDLDRNLIVRIPGRQRHLDQQDYAELKANLTVNQLVTPVTVRALADGKYELLAGYNRDQIYGELGRTTIKAWIIDADEADIEALAFYSNLLHPDLTPYEKYCGLKKIQASDEGLSQQDLAKKTGLSEATISQLMAFGRLPAEAHALLEKNPGIVGFDTAAKLAILVERGKSNEVVKAIEAASARQMTQSELLRVAEASKPQQPAKRQETTFKAGRRNYCKLITAQKTLRLDFATEEEREEFEGRVRILLEEISNSKKQAS